VICTHTNRWIDRQTDRQIDSDMHTYKQTDGQTDRHTDRQTDRQTPGHWSSRREVLDAIVTYRQHVSCHQSLDHLVLSQSTEADSH